MQSKTTKSRNTALGIRKNKTDQVDNMDVLQGVFLHNINEQDAAREESTHSSQDNEDRSKWGHIKTLSVEEVIAKDMKNESNEREKWQAIIEK